jgi:hypothetical protein
MLDKYPNFESIFYFEEHNKAGLKVKPHCHYVIQIKDMSIDQLRKSLNTSVFEEYESTKRSLVIARDVEKSISYTCKQKNFVCGNLLDETQRKEYEDLGYDLMINTIENIENEMYKKFSELSIFEKRGYEICNYAYTMRDIYRRLNKNMPPRATFKTMYLKQVYIWMQEFGLDIPIQYDFEQNDLQKKHWPIKEWYEDEFQKMFIN